MSFPENPTFFASHGDVTIVAKPQTVNIEVNIKGTTFRLTEEEARWLRDWLIKYVPKSN